MSMLRYVSTFRVLHPPPAAPCWQRKVGMWRRAVGRASTLLLFGSARSFSLLRGPFSPLSSRLQPPFRVRCQASLPDSEEGWRAVLTPAQFSVLRNAATEPPGYSENTEGELEYKLKTELKTKYPAEGAYR